MAPSSPSRTAIEAHRATYNGRTTRGPPDGKRVGKLSQTTAVRARYQIIAKVASGGMGEVYRARDSVLARDVAIKVLHRNLAGDPGFIERFRREARAAALLSHPTSSPSTTGGRPPTARISWSWSSSGGGTSATCSRTTTGSSPNRPSRSWSRCSPRSTTPTGTASCTATSSPRMSSSPPRGTSRWPTSGSPGRSPSPASARPRAPSPGPCSTSLPSRSRVSRPTPAPTCTRPASWPTSS